MYLYLYLCGLGGMRKCFKEDLRGTPNIHVQCLEILIVVF